MLIRRLDEVIGTERDVEWGGGVSRRLLVAADGRGYSFTETWVEAGGEALLRYDNHVEACYCIEGSGVVETENAVIDITPGTLYAPERGEAHVLRSATGMRLVCVFSPALQGAERHELQPGVPSSY